MIVSCLLNGMRNMEIKDYKIKEILMGLREEEVKRYVILIDSKKSGVCLKRI